LDVRALQPRRQPTHPRNHQHFASSGGGAGSGGRMLGMPNTLGSSSVGWWVAPSVASGGTNLSEVGASNLSVATDTEVGRKLHSEIRNSIAKLTQALLADSRCPCTGGGDRWAAERRRRGRELRRRDRSGPCSQQEGGGGGPDASVVVRGGVSARGSCRHDLPTTYQTQTTSQPKTGDPSYQFLHLLTHWSMSFFCARKRLFALAQGVCMCQRLLHPMQA
jgi:hypothetical protein